MARAGVTLHGNFSSGLQILASTLRNASSGLPLVLFTPPAESLRPGAVFMGPSLGGGCKTATLRALNGKFCGEHVNE